MSYLPSERLVPYQAVKPGDLLDLGHEDPEAEMPDLSEGEALAMLPIYEILEPLRTRHDRTAFLLRQGAVPHLITAGAQPRIGQKCQSWTPKVKQRGLPTFTMDQAGFHLHTWGHTGTLFLRSTGPGVSISDEVFRILNYNLDDPEGGAWDSDEARAIIAADVVAFVKSNVAGKLTPFTTHETLIDQSAHGMIPTRTRHYLQSQRPGEDPLVWPLIFGQRVSNTLSSQGFTTRILPHGSNEGTFSRFVEFLDSLDRG